MISPKAVKFRAVKMGIATGVMPNIDLIWARQEADGQRVCFGQGLTCSDDQCRWRGECRALDFFADVPISGLVLRNQGKRSLTKNIVNKQNSEYIVEREPKPAGNAIAIQLGSPGP